MIAWIRTGPAVTGGVAFALLMRMVVMVGLVGGPLTGTIVPLQALAMLHGPFAETSAAALSERFFRAESNDEARITYAYRLLFSREPRAKERAAIHEFLKAVIKETPGDANAALRAAWTQAALVLLNSNEFVFVH